MLRVCVLLRLLFSWKGCIILPARSQPDNRFSQIFIFFSPFCLFLFFSIIIKARVVGACHFSTHGQILISFRRVFDYRVHALRTLRVFARIDASAVMSLTRHAIRAESPRKRLNFTQQRVAYRVAIEILSIFTISLCSYAGYSTIIPSKVLIASLQDTERYVNQIASSFEIPSPKSNHEKEEEVGKRGRRTGTDTYHDS